MAFSATVQPLRPPSLDRGLTAYLVTITQTESAANEEWSVAGLPIYGRVIAYQTAHTAVGAGALTIHPRLGNAPGFVANGTAGEGIAVYRQAFRVIRSSSAFAALLPTGTLYGRSTFNRALVAGESVVTRIVIEDTGTTPVITEPLADWEVGHPPPRSVFLTVPAVVAGTWTRIFPLHYYTGKLESVLVERTVGAATTTDIRIAYDPNITNPLDAIYIVNAADVTTTFTDVLRPGQVFDGNNRDGLWLYLAPSADSTFDVRLDFSLD
jgi:hypothetical protein